DLVGALVHLVAPEPRLLDQPPAARVDDDPLVAPEVLDAVLDAPRPFRRRLDAETAPPDLVDRLRARRVGADHVLPRPWHAVEAARDLVHAPADAALVVLDVEPVVSDPDPHQYRGVAGEAPVGAVVRPLPMLLRFEVLDDPPAGQHLRVGPAPRLAAPDVRIRLWVAPE